MEYLRTKEGQIQADFARRAGQLLIQYEKLSRGLPSEENFEATLTVALLQSMLTICYESLEHSDKKDDAIGLIGLAKSSISEMPTRLGLEANCIMERWPSSRELSYREIFAALRNALSHPGLQGDSRYPITGYTTLVSGSNFIKAFEFVHSPWVNENGSGLRFPQKKKEEIKGYLISKAKKWESKTGDKSLYVNRDELGQWMIFRDGKKFVPVLRIHLTVQQLRTLTLTLSDMLSSQLEQAPAIHA